MSLPGVAVEGNDGSQFAPQLNLGIGREESSVPESQQSQLQTEVDALGLPTAYDVWWPEPMRPVRISYERTLTRFGVSVRRFALRPDGWGRRRYDGVGESDERAPMNLLDVTRAHEGTELFLSFPHFLHGAHDGIREGVGGLAPDEAKHGSVYDVEPTTGSVVNMRRRYQLVARVQRTKGDYSRILVPHCTRSGERLAGAFRGGSGGSSSRVARAGTHVPS